MSGAESIVVIFVLISLAVTVLFFVAGWKIVTKAGYPGWWVLITLVPVVGTVMFFVFAFSDWPVLQRPRDLEADEGQATAALAGEPSQPPSHAHRAAPGGTTVWLLALGAACFVLLFFSWNSLSACSPVTFGGSQPCVLLGGEIGWGGVGFLAGLLAVGLLAWEGLAWGGVLEPLDRAVAAAVPPVLAGAAALFAVIRVLTHVGSTSAAAWLGLLVFVALALLAALRWRALPGRADSAAASIQAPSATTIAAPASPAGPAAPASPATCSAPAAAEVAAAAQPPVRCSRCGTPTSADGRFCENCGMRLDPAQDGGPAD